MTLYIFALLYLSIITIYELFRPKSKWNKGLFIAGVVLLTFMVIFRYGQGPDYWPYRTVYADAPWKRGFPLFWYTRNLHSEIGFRFVINCFTALGIPAFYFYAVWSLVSMGFVYLAIERVSPFRSLSLLLLYPTCYLTYLFSGVRQGLVLAVFLYWGIRFYHQQKWIQYILLVGILSCFHVSAAVLLLVIPMKRIAWKRLLVLPPIALAIGLLFCFTPFHVWVSHIFNGALGRLETLQISWLGLAERSFMYLLIVGVMFFVGKDAVTELTEDLFRIYTTGYCIALAGMLNAYYSQRLSVPMKAVEILLFAMLVVKCKKSILKKCLVLGLTAVCWVMACKNLGAYFDDLNAFQYRYVGIWEGPDEQMEQYMHDVERWAENTYNEYP